MGNIHIKWPIPYDVHSNISLQFPFDYFECIKKLEPFNGKIKIYERLRFFDSGNFIKLKITFSPALFAFKRQFILFCDQKYLEELIRHDNIEILEIIEKEPLRRYIN